MSAVESGLGPLLARTAQEPSNMNRSLILWRFGLYRRFCNLGCFVEADMGFI